MAKMECKNFDTPDETRTVDKGSIEVVKLGDVTAMRARFEPGWRWSECVKPIVGGDSCQDAQAVKALDSAGPSFQAGYLRTYCPQTAVNTDQPHGAAS